jgi:SAM-dependent methyltransferase
MEPASGYVASTDQRNTGLLLELRRRMSRYYSCEQYHREWIRGINANWQPGSHPAQARLCEFIGPGSHVLEVGCGDGAAQCEIQRLVKNVRYCGVDLNPRLWSRGNFAAARAEDLPFRSETFDVVVSMFMIEHLVFPAAFLREAFRVLKPAGRLVLLAPDFERNAMASDRIGLGYGSGRDKLRNRKYADAALTFVDSRLRLPARRLLRTISVRLGLLRFPVLLQPRCLRLPGFTPDCDALYPASPSEISQYIRRLWPDATLKLFFRDRSTFGLMAARAHQSDWN